MIKSLQKKIESHILIENKKGKVVRFQLNDVQKKYLAKVTQRDIILKARQQGFSTLIDTEALIRCLKIPNYRAVIISHETEATQRLLQRIKREIERFYVGEKIVPISLEYNSKNELFFTETKSTIYIGTAGAKSFGRGDTIHFLHLSELAFYEHPEEILTAIIPAVPLDGRIVIETTANGFNFFKAYWERSKQGKTAFTPHFFGWHEHDEYALPGPSLTDLDETEQNLKARFNLTDDQLRWRRHTIAQYPDEEQFQQEYPADELEAFISSGRPVFNTHILKKYLENLEQPVSVGYVSNEGHFTQDEKGFVKIYKQPNPQEAYVIGVDVAEGLEHGDYSTGYVVSRTDFSVAAIWHGHIDPDLLGDEMAGLGYLYNTATVGVERNNHGLTTIAKMRHLYYPSLYHRTTLDKIMNQPLKEMGWRTDTKTKQLMIDDLNKAIREQSIEIFDEDTINELISYERDDQGATAAPEGMFDDRVMALAIALQMRKLTSGTAITPQQRNLHPRSIQRIFQEATETKRDDLVI